MGKKIWNPKRCDAAVLGICYEARNWKKKIRKMASYLGWNSEGAEI